MKICKKGHERSDQHSRCIECRKAQRQENKEAISSYSKTYRKNNRIELIEYKKKWREANEDKVAHYQILNKEHIAAIKRLYEKKNRVLISKKKKTYVKERSKTDPAFKLQRNLRTRLRKVLINKVKTGSAVRDLGCTGEELKSYLETLFKPGMTWNNYGNKEGQWSIDHIIPLSKVDLNNREEFLKVNHYTNLQPLWHIDNIKKSNKI